MAFQHDTALFTFIFLLAMSSPSTLIATSRIMFDSVLAPTTLEATIPTFKESIVEVPEASISLPPSSYEFTTFDPNGMGARAPIPASTFLSCMPKGPIRWSAPNPKHNNMLESTMC
ncbi:unnamed protein product [Citrullus colocynthis]|uniref:Uncharacterized protein n=1 Tax=Citrullus colocynthis TaxID=252529 RepID=A0ABP0Z8H3_9ROSI